MNYKFDLFGWFDGTSEEPGPRTTTIQPPTQAAPVVGEPYPCWAGDRWVDAPYAEPVPPPPMPKDPALLRLTKRSFQNRFPLLANGKSTKYDLMTQFLNDDTVADSMGVSVEVRTALRLLILTGLNRITASPYVNLAVSDAADFTTLLLSPMVPEAFRLSAEERAAILNEDSRPDEIYQGV